MHSLPVFRPTGSPRSRTACKTEAGAGRYSHPGTDRLRDTTETEVHLLWRWRLSPERRCQRRKIWRRCSSTVFGRSYSGFCPQTLPFCSNGRGIHGGSLRCLPKRKPSHDKHPGSNIFRQAPQGPGRHVSQPIGVQIQTQRSRNKPDQLCHRPSADPVTSMLAQLTTKVNTPRRYCRGLLRCLLRFNLFYL